MSSISFSGLASGLDTDSIIKGLMEVEKKPLTRLESDKAYFQNRLEAFKQFDARLSALNEAVDDLDLNSDLRESRVTLSSEEHVTADVTSAHPGSYQVAVEKLAQVQKSVTDKAFASKTDALFGTGELTLAVGEGVVSQGASGDTHTISVTEENNSLLGVMEAINEGTEAHGISASIIDNGNEGGDRYYLMLTGADASTEFTLNSSLGGGTESLSLDPPTQNAQDAVAYIDGVQITSETNTIENAINGVTMHLESANPADGSGGLETDTLTIDTNAGAVVAKMENFVKAYNETVSFVTSQSKVGDSSGGVLLGDSGLNNVKRRLQNLLVTQVEGNDSYSALSQLGLSTNRDGTVDFDAGAMTEAIGHDFEEVARLISGDDNVKGIFKHYREYLNDMTSPSSGLYANRQENIERTIDRIDDDILAMESRLDKREQMLVAKFSALEQLVSEMNSQSEYLTQQMDKMPSLGGKD